MKRILLSLGLTLLSVSALAVKGDYPAVKLSVNSETGLFAKGEKIVFSGRLVKPVTEPLSMVILREALPVDTLEVTLTSKDTPIYECSFDETASVIVRVGPSSDLKSYKDAGAVVAPENYRPGFDDPADFVQYWEGQKAALRASKPEATMTPVEMPEGAKPGYEAFALEISMPEGRPVHGYVVKPVEAKVGSIPIIMSFHGAGVNKPHNKSSLNTAASNATYGKGAISIDMNAHGYPDDQPQSYYDDLEHGDLAGYRTRRLTTREDYYFRLMVLRALRALDYLCTLPEWDGKRVVVSGGSQGGFQSMALAGIDSRVTYIKVGNPAHTDLASPRQGRKQAWPAVYERIMKSKKESAIIEDILPYFDASNFIRHTNAILDVSVGLQDTTCPTGCVLAAYNVCPSKDKTIWINPFNGHGAKMDKEQKAEFKRLVDVPRWEKLNEYMK